MAITDGDIKGRRAKPARHVLRMMNEPRVKGVGLLGFKTSIREVLGDEVHSRTVAALPAEVRDGLRFKTITPSAWVPLDWHRALHDCVVAASRSGPGVCRRVAHHTTRVQLNGVYRALARVAGPEMTFPRASATLRTYYSQADVTVVDTRRGFTRAEFRECTGFSAAIWENIAGASEAILEVSGAHTIRLRIVDGGQDGDDRATIEARWL